jgi:glycerol uptake facilitator-like aquaporin
MLRKIFAEFLGTTALLGSIIGSGIMATNVTSDLGSQLIINMISIIAMLVLLILVLGPVSGAHLNPLVTLLDLYYRRIEGRLAGLYLIAQLAGSCLGVGIADLMYRKPFFFTSTHHRAGSNLFLSEVIATAGLIGLVQFLHRQNQTRLAPIAVPLWITSAFFMTSSFVFANPTITFARSLSNTFSGIAPSSVPTFILAQFLGAALGVFSANLISGRVSS